MVHLTSRQNAQPCSVDIAKNLDVPIRTHFSITNVGTHWCRGAVYKPVRWIFCHTRGGYVCQRAYQSRPYTSGGGLFEWDNGLINRAPTPVAAGYSNGIYFFICYFRYVKLLKYIGIQICVVLRRRGKLFIMSNIYQKKQRFVDQRWRRKTLRLNVRDYSAPGFYYITICTLDKTLWLGNIANDEICLSPAGRIVQSVWESLPQRFPGMGLDGFVVMPNHVHGIILLTEHLRYNRPGQISKPTLSKIVDTYKGAATYLIRRTAGIPDFSWQKSCYDIIMRNECALHRTRRYIAKNPERWIADRFYTRDTMGNM